MLQRLLATGALYLGLGLSAFAQDVVPGLFLKQNHEFSKEYKLESRMRSDFKDSYLVQVRGEKSLKKFKGPALYGGLELRFQDEQGFRMGPYIALKEDNKYHSYMIRIRALMGKDGANIQARVGEKIFTPVVNVGVGLNYNVEDFLIGGGDIDLEREIIPGLKLGARYQFNLPETDDDVLVQQVFGVLSFNTHELFD